MWLPHVTGADTYEIRLCPYCAVNVVPDSGRGPGWGLGAVQRGPTGRPSPPHTPWAAHEQHESVDLFLERTCAAFGDLPSTRFDPVTVTKYEVDQFQAKHLDARLPHQINRNAAYLATGGQRIAQLICYLQAPEAGGETKFFGPAFGGLAVQPKKGSALIFPTATLEGLADERYLHSGEPVQVGTKWIVGTWLMEKQRTDAKDVRKAIDELWKLEGKDPPARRAVGKANGGGMGSEGGAAAVGKKKKKRAKGKK